MEGKLRHALVHNQPLITCVNQRAVSQRKAPCAIMVGRCILGLCSLVNSSSSAASYNENALRTMSHVLRWK